MATGRAEKVQKSKNAHGLGVYEVRFEDGRWRTVADSRYGRRITADTPFRIKGPAAGHPLMRTAEDPSGTRVRGTFQNCANGYTPWGTYLSCEENFTAYFVNDSGQHPAPAGPLRHPDHEGQLGLPLARVRRALRRGEASQRAQPLRLGGGVRSLRSGSEPVKHTAMGRMAHEGAALSMANDGRVVYYMGDDDYRSRFEHIYKFVSQRPYVKGGGCAENQDILDEGTLYAAQLRRRRQRRVDRAGAGQERARPPSKGFASQAEVVIDARTAGDVVGATYMDRPEWIAVHPRSQEVYVTLSNNTSRGNGQAAAPGRPRSAPTPPIRARPT